jgi:hypothetical protein
MQSCSQFDLRSAALCILYRILLSVKVKQFCDVRPVNGTKKKSLNGDDANEDDIGN